MRLRRTWKWFFSTSSVKLEYLTQPGSFWRPLQNTVLFSSLLFGLTADDLSFETLVEESERLKCLSAAVTCAVLAPAGPQRSRVLAILYKDDRVAQNLPTDFAILEKMHFLRLLTPQEVAEFAKSLKPHQLALLPGDQQVTVLSNAVLEHNLAAASQVYDNIGFDELGRLLGITGLEAEKYAATMIEQGRLKGWIDQPSGFIYFEEGSGGGESAMSGRVRRNWSSTIRWDDAIKELSTHVESIASVFASFSFSPLTFAGDSSHSSWVNWMVMLIPVISF
jgi:COP9 signalosome complex subunit 4